MSETTLGGLETRAAEEPELVPLQQPFIIIIMAAPHSQLPLKSSLNSRLAGLHISEPLDSPMNWIQTGLTGKQEPESGGGAGDASGR